MSVATVYIMFKKHSHFPELVALDTFTIDELYELYEYFSLAYSLKKKMLIFIEVS